MIDDPKFEDWQTKLTLVIDFCQFGVLNMSRIRSADRLLHIKPVTLGGT